MEGGEKRKGTSLGEARREVLGQSCAMRDARSRGGERGEGDAQEGEEV